MFHYMTIKYRLNLFRLSRKKLVGIQIRFKLFDFMRWILVDFLDSPSKKGEFKEYGVTMYIGSQGAGKTISMVHYLYCMRNRYPNCLIVTNFDCDYADVRMESWRDFLDIRNGEDGIIFAIDEIHSEYNNKTWKDFPEELLSEISQQRKQRVKIVASAQEFTDVVKQIKNQTLFVVECSTFMGRWTFCKTYQRRQYLRWLESGIADPKKKPKTLMKHSFVQSNWLRESYDTYAKIERMQRVDFIPRDERGG